MVKPRRPVDIYVRVSRKGARENLIAPEDQEREARRFAEAEGIRLSGVVLEDIDKSGGTLERPGLREARSRVEEGASGGIIVAYLSRLSRETRQGLALLEEITAAGGAVYAPNLPDYTTADGKMLTTIQLAVDTGYRERKGEELERAKENAIANGVPIVTRPAVGYRRRSKDDRRLAPDPDVAPLVHEVFERRAAGEGPAALGAFLTENGVKTSQGSKTWSKAAIYNLLRNRVYLGELAYGRDRRFVNATAHEPLVDVALWQAAQGNGARRLAPARSEASPFLVTGLARCAGCRYCLQATRTSRGVRIYRCGRTHSGGVCPNPTRVKAEPVERAAVAAFWAITDDLEAEGRHDDSGLVAQFAAELEHAEQTLAQFLSVEVQEAIGDTAEYAAGLRERRQARDTAVERRNQAQAERASVNALPDRDTLRAAWERMDTQERRELLALRFDCLAISRDGSIVAYPAGTAPSDLPRRGFDHCPRLARLLRRSARRCPHARAQGSAEGTARHLGLSWRSGRRRFALSPPAPAVQVRRQ